MRNSPRHTGYGVLTANFRRWYPGEFGKTLFVDVSNPQRDLEHARLHNYKSIHIRAEASTNTGSLDFLLGHNYLKSIRITMDGLNDLRALYELPKLRTLILPRAPAFSVARNCLPFDFSQLAKLRDLETDWIRGADTIGSCPQLRYLSVTSLPERSVQVISSMRELLALSITRYPCHDLTSLRKLTYLRTLELAYSRLRSLTGLDNLKKLIQLTICNSRQFTRIDQIGKLPKLRRLGIHENGDIDTLRPLNRCGALRVCTLGSTNIVDGDLRPLLRLRHRRPCAIRNNLRSKSASDGITTVAHQDRKHYSHTCREIEQRIPFKPPTRWWQLPF